jgi:hypothetical protein
MLSGHISSQREAHAACSGVLRMGCEQITKKSPRSRSLVKHLKAASCSPLPLFHGRGRSPSRGGQVVAVRTSWQSDATLLWAVGQAGERGKGSP